MTEIYGIWDAMSTIDCIMKERAAMSSKVRFQKNGAWRLIVAQIIFGLRSRHDRFLPAVRRIVACAVFTSRPFAFGRCRLGTAQAQARHARHLQPGFGPTQVASASWLGPINLRGHRLRRVRTRGSFALRLLTHACPNCYDSGTYFQIEKCCGWAYTVITLPVAVRYS